MIITGLKIIVKRFFEKNMKNRANFENFQKRDCLDKRLARPSDVSKTRFFSAVGTVPG
jgi:hypothetical protein